MKKINNEKKTRLLKIEKARIVLELDLENGLIKEKDILELLKAYSDYGCLKPKKLGYRESVLKQIYNCPFLLCDQKYLSSRVKSILPVFLNVRYNMELNELDLFLEQGELSYDEYLDEKEMLKFCYYGSSIEGKEIRNNGHSRSAYSKTKIK